MSKHAIEAYGDGLAAELGAPRRAREPHRAGELWHRDREESPRADGHERREGLALRGADAVGDQLDAAASRTIRRPTRSRTRCSTRSRARTRSRVTCVGARRRQGAIAIRKLMDEIVQLNATQKFTLDRDALVKMLDDAIARATPKP